MYKRQALAIVLVPILVNVWNFMDGIDGLAASKAALCALARACVTASSAQWLSLVVVAACLGFLPFNAPKARIFLGDVGSGALGYLMALLLLASLPARAPMLWPLLLLPLTAMLVDAGMTLGWRIWRGERWWQPHVRHLYQRFARRFGHGRVTAAYAGWTALAIGIMLAALQRAGAVDLGAGMTFVVVSLWLWVVPVSYTHLDVYKRQGLTRCSASWLPDAASECSAAKSVKLATRTSCCADGYLHALPLTGTFAWPGLTNGCGLSFLSHSPGWRAG